MGIDYSSPAARRSWRAYMVIIALVTLTELGLSIADLVMQGEETTTATEAPQYILQGDVAVRVALVLSGDGRREWALAAIESYQGSLPSPAGYRRIAVVKAGLLNERNVPEFDKIDSPEATRGLPPSTINRLHQEVLMWKDVYSPDGISVEQAGRYARRADKLDLGPLKRVAAAEIYKSAEQAAEWTRAFGEAKTAALSNLEKVGVFLALAALAGLVGIVVLIRFLSTNRAYFRSAGRPKMQASVLILSFLSYQVSTLGFAVALMSAFAAFGDSDALFLGVQAAASLVGLTVGLSVFGALISHTRESPGEAGLRPFPLRQALKWGSGGWLAAIPVVFAGVIASQVLMNTVFRNVPTQDSPLTPIVSGGGPVEIAAVLVLAVIVAPLVEETFFRGMLYTAFRDGLGVWPSAILSATVFALGHPLPAHFLPILGLGVVLALIRERSGSLVPGMVCHGIYNAFVTILGLLVF